MTAAVCTLLPLISEAHRTAFQWTPAQQRLQLHHQQQLLLPVVQSTPDASSCPNDHPSPS